MGRAVRGQSALVGGSARVLCDHRNHSALPLDVAVRVPIGLDVMMSDALVDMRLYELERGGGFAR
jgi:hypothetical protein